METVPQVTPAPDELHQIRLSDLIAMNQIDRERAWKYLARKFEMDITGFVENHKESKIKKGTE